MPPKGSKKGDAPKPPPKGSCLEDGREQPCRKCKDNRPNQCKLLAGLAKRDRQNDDEDRLSAPKLTQRRAPDQ